MSASQYLIYNGANCNVTHLAEATISKLVTQTATTNVSQSATLRCSPQDAARAPVGFNNILTNTCARKYSLSPSLPAEFVQSLRCYKSLLWQHSEGEAIELSWRLATIRESPIKCIQFFLEKLMTDGLFHPIMSVILEINALTSVGITWQ